MNPKQLDFSKMFLKPERQTMKTLLGVDMMWVGSEKEFKFADLGGTTMDRDKQDVTEIMAGMSLGSTGADSGGFTIATTEMAGIKKSMAPMA